MLTRSRGDAERECNHGSSMMHTRSWSVTSAYVRLPPSPSRAYAMGMPARQTDWTAEMVRALPDDGKRHEVLDGVLVVSPAPSWHHQRAVRILLTTLEAHCARHGIGEAL